MRTLERGEALKPRTLQLGLLIDVDDEEEGGRVPVPVVVEDTSERQEVDRPGFMMGKGEARPPSSSGSGRRCRFCFCAFASSFHRAPALPHREA